MKKIILISLFTLSLTSYSQTLSQISKGSKFNPAIGLNALALYKNSARDADHDGLKLQEVELQFSSDVDAYFRAEATLALHQEEHEDSGHAHEYKIHPEEAFVETLSIPKVTIRAGKSYVNFGKYNAIHSHALPFIYRSNLQETMFGHDGLAEAMVGGSALAPLPWFSEINVQALQPTNETLFVDSHHGFAYAVKWKNLWELSDELTVELGTSGLSFSNHGHGQSVEDKTSLLGADLTFKWRPTKDGKNSSFLWSTELIHKDRAGSSTDKIGGYTTFVRYQMLKRWYVQGGYEFVGLSKNDGVKDLNAYTGLVAFVPTEFSSIRTQFDSIHDGSYKPEKRVSLQLNISIGAHPAHQY